MFQRRVLPISGLYLLLASCTATRAPEQVLAGGRVAASLECLHYEPSQHGAIAVGVEQERDADADAPGLPRRRVPDVDGDRSDAAQEPAIRGAERERRGARGVLRCGVQDRPGRLVDDISVDLERPRRLEDSYTEKFGQIASAVRNAINNA